MKTNEWLPRIELLKEKKLIGQNMKMSLINNKTGELWRQFAPRIKEIKRRVTADQVSLQIYPPRYYEEFSAANKFVKWSAVEVEDFFEMPIGMESFIIDGGLYPVFEYKGSSSDHSIFQYILSEWLPNSGYVVDARPHFEVLGSTYKINDTNSEEEIWIPVKAM